LKLDDPAFLRERTKFSETGEWSSTFKTYACDPDIPLPKVMLDEPAFLNVEGERIRIRVFIFEVLFLRVGTGHATAEIHA
jgi:hypothetical protein